MQATLDSFQNDRRTPEPVNKSMILVSIVKEFNASWHDRDWFFRKNDIVHIRKDLAALLISRGIARKTIVKGRVQLHE